MTKKILNDLVLNKRRLGHVREIGIVFCTDSFIRKLNREYRGKDKATDVLSFAMQEGAGRSSTALGDVVISVATAKRQAREYEVNLYQEILRLIIHGVLHLCGYDHEGVSKRAAQDMRKLEDSLYYKHLKVAKGILPQRSQRARR